MGDNGGLVLEFGQFNLPFKRNAFSDDKMHLAFVKKCVSMVRMTPEYRDWTSYIKDTLGHKTCVFTEETADELTIELHHHPFTLFDITDVTLCHCLMSGESFTSLDITQKVLELHYSNCVGYMPIVTSLHEKYHNGFLVIPPKFVLGTWDYLINNDDYHIDDALLERVTTIMKADNNMYDQYFKWQKCEVTHV